jgi:hypothetical protein
MKSLRRPVLFLLFGLLVFFVFPVLAFAQATPAGPIDLNLFDRLYKGVTTGNWQYAASAAVILLNSFLIWIDDYTGDNTWLDKGFYKWSFGIFLSALGGLVTRLAAETPMVGVLDWIGPLAHGAFIGFAAAGMYKGAKEAKELKDGGK